MSRVTRIEKLETRRRMDDAMLLIWRKPGHESEATALMAKAAGLFVPGDRVICAEWVRRRQSSGSTLDPPLRNRSYRDRKRILRSHHRKAYQQGPTEIDGPGLRYGSSVDRPAHVHLPGCRDMKDLTGRLERLETRAGRRSGLSSERRKHLTDRAVLHGDQEAGRTGTASTEQFRRRR
jgi:hypothetical protein